MVTTVAISLLRFAESEFMDKYPDLSSFTAIMSHLKLDAGAVGSDIVLRPLQQDGRPDIPEEPMFSEQLISMLCVRAYLIMLGVKESLREPMDKTKSLDTLSPSPLFEVHPFGHVLRSLIPDFKLAPKEPQGWTFIEHFSQGLHAFVESAGDRLPAWLVAACQINMDIHDNVEFDSNLEIQKFQAKIQSLQSSLRNVINEFQFKEDNGKRYISSEKLVGSVAEDPYHEARQNFLRSLGSDYDPTPLSFRVRKGVPVRLGTLAFTAALTAHSRGVELGSTAGIVLSAAYLYKAALVVGAVTKPWKDMEFVIDAQSKKRPFVLVPKNGIESMAMYFGNALGIPYAAFANGQRPRLPKKGIINSKIRLLVIDWPIVNGIIEYTKWNDMMAPVDRDLPVVNAAIQSINRLEKLESKTEQAVRLVQQYKSTGKLTPSELMLAFKDIFISDEMELHFDNLKFFWTCAELWKALHLAGGTMLHQLLDQNFEENVAPLYEMVYLALWDAANQNKTKNGIQSSLLWHIGKLIEAMIEEEGDKCYKLAQAQTSGSLAERLSQDSSEGVSENSHPSQQPLDAASEQDT